MIWFGRSNGSEVWEFWGKWLWLWKFTDFGDCSFDLAVISRDGFLGSRDLRF